MIIIGINAYHGDSSACLVREGEVVAAVEEERFNRVKHWAGFPAEAIRYCLQESGLSMSDVDVVAVNSDPSAHLLKKVQFSICHRPSIGMILDRLQNQSKRQEVEAELGRRFTGQPFRGEVVRVEHHLAHLASAFLVSPFREAVVASVDGFGDFSSTVWGVGHDASIKVDGRVHFPHSLGIFYQALTQYLGFPRYGDEYKVMGLAPYGRPNQLSLMRKIVKLKDGGRFSLETEFFRHHQEKVNYTWNGGAPHVGSLYSSALEDLLGPSRNPDSPLEQRHYDIARSVQAMYEEAFFHLADHLYDHYRLDTLTLAGGCAMNSVANGKLVRRTHFNRLYVQSAAGDAGGAVGAALYVWHKNVSQKVKNKSPRIVKCALSGDERIGRSVMDHAYLGPAANRSEISVVLEERASEIAESCCKVEQISKEAELCHQIAEAIAGGNIVGWFQGRMEWGPRALGNRSILCDPRRADMKEILNRKIKRRESFRPFAPSVLKEHVVDWFEEDGDVPFMMQVYQIREERQSLIPAVTHVDGSGRLQTVYKETNPRYWGLIDAFRRITGVPMLLNTSFNENEPVVCRPIEALDCFLRTRMDILVIESYVIRREQANITSRVDSNHDTPVDSDVVLT